MLKTCVKNAFEYAKKIDSFSSEMKVEELPNRNIGSNDISVGLVRVLGDSELNLIQKTSIKSTLKVNIAINNYMEYRGSDTNPTTTIILMDMLGLSEEEAINRDPTTNWNDPSFIEQWLKASGAVDTNWKYSNDSDTINVLTDFYKQRLTDINENIDIVIKNMEMNIKVGVQAYATNKLKVKVINARDAEVNIEQNNTSVNTVLMDLNDYANENRTENEEKDLKDNTKVDMVKAPDITNQTVNTISKKTNTLETNTKSTIDYDVAKKEDNSWIIIGLVIFIAACVIFGVYLYISDDNLPETIENENYVL